jgi:hypothetical protein
VLAITEAAIKEAPLPVKYEAAKAALAECSSVDECSTWAKKAAALASYARQADDRSLEDMAARIRARAIRRIGELLKAIPKSSGGSPTHKSTRGDAAPSSPRARAAADADISPDQVKDALRLANIKPKDFEAAVEGERVPTITELAERGTKKQAPLVDLKGRDPAAFNRSLHIAARVNDLAGEAAKVTPKVMASGCLPRQAPALRQSIKVLSKWLADLSLELENV